MLQSGIRQSTRRWWITTLVGNLLIGVLIVIPVLMVVFMSATRWLGPMTGVYGDNEDRNTESWILLALGGTLVVWTAMVAWLLNSLLISRLRGPRRPPSWLLSALLIPLPTAMIFLVGTTADW